MNKNKKYIDNSTIFGIILLLIILIIGLFFIYFKYNYDKNYNVYVEEIPEYSNYSLADLEEAFNYWKARESVRFILTDDEKDADFSIKWIKEFSGEGLGHTDRGKLVLISLGDSDCQQEWQSYTEESISKIVEHEIGHVLGYPHSNNANDIMYFEIEPKYLMDMNKMGNIESGYARYYLMCQRFTQGIYSVNIEAENTLEVYVGEKEDLERIQTGNVENISTLSEVCDEQNNGSYERCNLTNKDFIILLNKNKEPVRFRLTIKQN